MILEQGMYNNRKLPLCHTYMNSTGPDRPMHSKALNKITLFNPKILIFFLLLHENILCGNSLEAPLKSTHNVFVEK